MIRGSDGLDYEDLTARLLGTPAETPYNDRIAALRLLCYPEEVIRAYMRGYDAYIDAGYSAQGADLRSSDDAGAGAGVWDIERFGAVRRHAVASLFP